MSICVTKTHGQQQPENTKRRLSIPENPENVFVAAMSEVCS
jgi:hypothetical protein